MSEQTNIVTTPFELNAEEAELIRLLRQPKAPSPAPQEQTQKADPPGQWVMDDDHLPEDIIQRAHFDDELDAAERLALYVVGHQALHFAFSRTLLQDEGNGLNYLWMQTTRAIMLALPVMGHGNLDDLAQVARAMVI